LGRLRNGRGLSRLGRRRLDAGLRDRRRSRTRDRRRHAGRNGARNFLRPRSGRYDGRRWRGWLGSGRWLGRRRLQRDGLQRRRLLDLRFESPGGLSQARLERRDVPAQILQLLQQRRLALFQSLDICSVEVVHVIFNVPEPTRRNFLISGKLSAGCRARQPNPFEQ